MGIVKLQPDAPAPVETTKPITIEAPAKSIFTALVPESKIGSLLKYVEGYPWTVDFYGQILNTNNTVENFDPTTPNLTQPYYKVNKMILQVSSPISSSYDQSTGLTTITGSALTPYRITPNFGDVFVAQVDSGEDAIFHITSIKRATHRKDTLYEISYNLYCYTSDRPDFLVTLNQRVNDTYFFNPDTNFFNRDVLIKPSVKEAIDRLKLFMDQSQQYYFSTFAQKRTGSIMIPGIDYTLYDPLLVNFIAKIVDYSVLVDTPFHRFTYFDKYIDQQSIFDMLMARSVAMAPVINKTYNFMPSALTSNKARFGSVYHAGVDYILYPTNPNTNADINETSFFATPEYISTIKTAKNYNTDTPVVIKTTNNNQVYDKDVLHDLFTNNYYVVSEHFYPFLKDNTGYEEISFIELLIARFLKNEAIAKEDLAVAVEKYTSWSMLHQLYLLPVMWLIIKGTI